MCNEKYRLFALKTTCFGQISCKSVNCRNATFMDIPDYDQRYIERDLKIFV